MVALFDGRTLTVPIAWYPRLLHATAEQRKKWQIAGAGFGIHWPDIDERSQYHRTFTWCACTRKRFKSRIRHFHQR
ncbi:MAG: DUF2442 domain-containing protein [Desulfotignum sp.]|nr:DUF2442 domain-containing protein [Desulfotignum sp.]